VASAGPCSAAVNFLKGDSVNYDELYQGPDEKNCGKAFVQ
jgi:hypothetical protein